jgi:hypothetical protein
MQAYKVRVLKDMKAAGQPVKALWVVLANSADQAASITLSHLSAGDAVTDCAAIELDLKTVAKLGLSQGTTKQLYAGRRLKLACD